VTAFIRVVSVLFAADLLGVWSSVNVNIHNNIYGNVQDSRVVMHS